MWGKVKRILKYPKVRLSDVYMSKKNVWNYVLASIIKKVIQDDKAHGEKYLRSNYLALMITWSKMNKVDDQDQVKLAQAFKDELGGWSRPIYPS